MTTFAMDHSSNGKYSEEAQEARNQHNWKFREQCKNKTSKMNPNTDLLDRLLITSDSAIANLRACLKAKHNKLIPEKKFN